MCDDGRFQSDNCGCEEGSLYLDRRWGARKAVKSNIDHHTWDAIGERVCNLGQDLNARWNLRPEFRCISSESAQRLEYFRHDARAGAHSTTDLVWYSDPDSHITKAVTLPSPKTSHCGDHTYHHIMYIILMCVSSTYSKWRENSRLRQTSTIPSLRR